MCSDVFSEYSGDGSFIIFSVFNEIECKFMTLDRLFLIVVRVVTFLDAIKILVLYFNSKLIFNSKILRQVKLYLIWFLELKKK